MDTLWPEQAVALPQGGSVAVGLTRQSTPPGRLLCAGLVGKTPTFLALGETITGTVPDGIRLRAGTSTQGPAVRVDTGRLGGEISTIVIAVVSAEGSAMPLTDVRGGVQLPDYALALARDGSPTQASDGFVLATLHRGEPWTLKAVAKSYSAEYLVKQFGTLNPPAVGAGEVAESHQSGPGSKAPAPDPRARWGQAGILALACMAFFVLRSAGVGSTEQLTAGIAAALALLALASRRMGRPGADTSDGRSEPAGRPTQGTRPSAHMNPIGEPRRTPNAASEARPRGAKGKQQHLMEMEAVTWRTPYEIPEALEILRAAARASGPGGLRGKITGEVVSEEPGSVALGWQLGGLVPTLWFSTVLESDNGGSTTITLEVMRANFSRQFPFPWTMSGRDLLRKFKRLAAEQLALE